jgi:hypothetical protein
VLGKIGFLSVWEVGWGRAAVCIRTLNPPTTPVLIIRIRQMTNLFIFDSKRRRTIRITDSAPTLFASNWINSRSFNDLLEVQGPWNATTSTNLSTGTDCSSANIRGFVV